MGVRLRDDVIDSFRLVVRTEWWVAVDLLAGLAGYAVWVAGSAALGLQVASLADYPVAPGGVPTTPVLGLIALLWLILPAAVGVARVRSRVLNIRGNVDQAYRFDRPAALLAPPALVLAFAAAAAVAMDAVEPLLFLVLVPVTLYLLVRTITYSYRVYAFSHPLVLYAALFATLVVQAAVLLLYLGMTTENEAVVTATVDSLGLPIDPLGSTDLGVLTTPTGLGGAVALPLAVTGAYLVAQTIAALIVRVREPTIRPSRVRTGQRYPEWLDVASNGSRSRRASASSGKATPASTSSASSGSGSGSKAASASSSSGSGGADSAAASTGSSAADDATTAASGDASPGGPTAAGTADAGADASEADDAAEAEDAESVSHTRVFTPPGGGGDDPLSPSAVEDSRDCPDCGATVPGDADECPACGTESV